MKTLTEQEVQHIADYLEPHLSRWVPLREELLDHLCCQVEAAMEQGATFEQAIEQTFAVFSAQALSQIEEQTLYSLQNNSNTMMKVFAFSLLAAMMTITSFWLVSFDPPSGLPVSGKMKVSSAFGMRMHPIHKTKKMHRGVDFVMPIGTPILATADGVVTEIQQKNTGYGNLIVIRHDEIYETRYGQLSEIKVEVGQKVGKGETIALSGNSGSSTGPHLHYELLENGEFVDPEPYFQHHP